MVINEEEIRALADRNGFILHRSANKPSLSNRGQWMLIRKAGARRVIVLGRRYDASLANVERYLNGDEL